MTSFGKILLNSGSEPGLGSAQAISEALLSKMKDLEGEFYQVDGTVDYPGLRESASYADFKILAAGLRKFDPALLETREEKLAFWLNVYNVIVVDAIIALGIKKSVKETRGFFKRVKYDIGGQHFSPDDIEHGILRANTRGPGHAMKQFGPSDKRRPLTLDGVDPRVHFALVCGSTSCPPIKFYSQEKIDDQLDIAAGNFINGSDVELDREKRTLRLNMIFKWYEGDFGGKLGVVDFIRRYLDKDEDKEFLISERENISLEYKEYDWSINS